LNAPLRVFITGASSGIGEALARHYAQCGAQLGLVARRAQRLQALADALAAPCATYELDVRDVAGMRAAAADFLQRFGGADIVIGNAGVSAGTLTDHAEDQEVFQEILDVNVVGLFNTFQPFVPAMLAAKRGTLAGIASVAGFRGLPGSGAYSASKAAARTYLESLRVDLHRTGVRVVTISPGYIRSEMTAKNPYPMPFILDAGVAAQRMASAIERGTAHTVIPWQMGIVGALLRVLPRPLYDTLFARTPRKPRREETGSTR
jgi:NADP-dependent 3-hydroxy acid dehydrogenase YdfG